MDFYRSGFSSRRNISLEQTGLEIENSGWFTDNPTTEQPELVEIRHTQSTSHSQFARKTQLSINGEDLFKLKTKLVVYENVLQRISKNM